MHTIEIDFDVFKALTQRRATEEVTYNDVLRELLGLAPTARAAVEPPTAPNIPGWFTKGVSFPEGTEFRATYRGQTYYGKVESGALVVNGRRFDSPSAAAVAITRSPTNGWIFWQCRLPGKTSWQIIKSLRK